MTPGLVRSAKVAGLPIAAAAMVLLAEFVLSLGMPFPPGADLPWEEMVSDELGTVVEREEADDAAVRSLWPVERDGRITAVVVVASAPGYRSRIDVGVTVGRDGTVLAERVVAHSESAYVRRVLDNGVLDGVSGATLTERGIRMATVKALAAAREYIEEQR